MDTNLIESVDLNKTQSIQEVANILISEDISSGTPVAVTEDPTFPFSGQRGTSRGPADKKGYTNVEFPNGTVVPMQTSLLLSLK